MINRISINEAVEIINNQEAIVVDIRDPNAFNQGHIEHALRLDNSNIAEFLAEADKSKPIIVCCYHGHSSQPAAEMFNQQGFEQSYSLDGGMSEWLLSQKFVTEE